MKFVIVANPWSDGVKNPTSKHHIAKELLKKGHDVLWIDGAGMRVPDLSLSEDRQKIVRKVRKALKDKVKSYRLKVKGGESSRQLGNLTTNNQTAAPAVVSPLFIPLPQFKWARRYNGWLILRIVKSYMLKVKGYSRNSSCELNWIYRLSFKCECTKGSMFCPYLK